MKTITRVAAGSSVDEFSVTSPRSGEPTNMGGLLAAGRPECLPNDFSAGGGAFLQSASPSGTSLAPVPADSVLGDTSPQPSPRSGEGEKSGALRKVCMDCGAELPGSNPQGTRVSHGLCVVDFERRMAELKAA